MTQKEKARLFDRLKQQLDQDIEYWQRQYSEAKERMAAESVGGRAWAGFAEDARSYTVRTHTAAKALERVIGTPCPCEYCEERRNPVAQPEVQV